MDSTRGESKKGPSVYISKEAPFSLSSIKFVIQRSLIQSKSKVDTSLIVGHIPLTADSEIM